jgi:HEAT repeat protein
MLTAPVSRSATDSRAGWLVRWAAAEILLERGGGLSAVLPLLDDTQDGVRWHVLGLLARHGDKSAVGPLIAKLRSDPDPGEGQAAYALGHIGSPEAIPHLLGALDHDRECDSQGHSPSSICATQTWDYDAVKTQAWELYRKRKAHPNAR